MAPRMRTLVFAGLLAASGCATTQTAGTVPAPSASASASAARRQDTPAQRCQRERRSKVQECIIEGVIAGCRREGIEEEFLSCVSEGLAQPNDMAATRQVSVTVSQGEEVLSMRTGGAAVMDIARLDATTIDATGVVFTFSIERLATAAPDQKAQVLSADVRMNYDGKTAGDWYKLRGLGLWNLRVQAADSGRASVSFETNDPGILAGAADEAVGRKKK